MTKSIVLTKLFIFLLVFSVYSQTENSEKLKVKVINDPIFQMYNSLLDKEVELFSKKQVTFKNVDINYIKLHRSEAKNETELIDIYEKAGMKNAKVYVETSNRIIATGKQLVNKYSGLSQMTDVERKFFFKSILPKANIDAIKNPKERKEKKLL